ncbi:MAG: hypothetical protein K2G28_03185 [Acetatifactor sp.]|nr:hypothetical protein [Acetatifactor sp.]MDE7352898.1 hypothetical protein [Acetatifactor sp.]
MKEKIELISELLTQQLNHWILFPLALTIMGLTSSYTSVLQPDLPMWVVCGLFPVVFYILRAKISRFPLFALSHAAAVSLSMAVPAQGSVNRVICIVCGIYYMIHSFALRIKDIPVTPLMHPFMSLGISLLSMLLLHQQNAPGWDAFYLFALAGCFGLYFIIYYLQQYLTFLSLNAGSAGFVPAKEMFSSGIGLVLGYTLFCTVILTLFTNLSRLEAIAGLIKKMITGILRFFFSLFRNDQPEPEMQPIESAAPPPFSDMVPLDAAEGEPFWLWEVLEKAAVAALICLCAYCILRLVLQLIRFIRKHFFWQIRRQTVDMDTGVSEVREKCDRTKTRSAKRTAPSGFLTPSAQIRRLYRKKLLQSGPFFTEGHPGGYRFFTAREWERILETKGMACLYEQARYSQTEMTRSDVRKMREAVKTAGYSRSTAAEKSMETGASKKGI